MLPIRDHHPSGKAPLVTYTLIGLNAAIFVLMVSMDPVALADFIDTYALIPAHIITGQKLYTLLTSMFLHGGFGHIIFNMLFLHIFGDNLEEAVGHFKFLLYYLAAGLAGSLLQIFIDPLVTIPNLGASGAIAGVMGGYLLLYPKAPIDVVLPLGFLFYRTTLPAFFMLFYWFILQFFSGLGSFLIPGQGVGGVAFFAHIGGFIAGFLLLLPFRRRLLRFRFR